MEDCRSVLGLGKILLVRSTFKRIPNVVFNDSVKNNVDTKVQYAVKGDTLNVEVEVDYSQISGEIIQVKASASVIGVFTVDKCDEQTIVGLAKHNCPAIIFPYVREQISSLCLKGGLGSVIIPPVDFNKLEVEREENE